MNNDQCCCQSNIENNIPIRIKAKKPWISDFIKAPGGNIPLISSVLTFTDIVGFAMMRLSFGRNDYRVEPGIYAIGSPDPDSPVIVTANYKMSFDIIRNTLKNRSAWILVLDTNGINVWCAAGKGTFGTEELIKKIFETGLSAIVSHRLIILPQLGAPGVSAHIVKKETGFKVNYGPVRASDIPQYLDDGMKATSEMRKVTFTLPERLILTPVELIGSLNVTLWALIISFIIGGISLKGFDFQACITNGLTGFMLYLSGLICGAIIVPALLPYIPGRAFSLKGFIIGFFIAILVSFFFGYSAFKSISVSLIIITTSSFFAMNFTGATPFTSLSGVKKEMKYALPLQIIFLITGTILWKISLLC